jgi:hypothetical protein
MRVEERINPLFYSVLEVKGLGRMTEIIKENIRHNRSFDYSHITDPYMKEKLDKGLIKYEPDEWTEITPVDENKLEGYKN